MLSQIKLGRIAGIDVGIHFSWLIVAVLIALSLAGHFRTINPNWSNVIIWSAALITALLFFVSLLLHEFAHSLVAKSFGLRVRAITLFALGGVSQIESEPSDAKSEFWIAIVGPIASALLGLVLIAIARAGGWKPGTEASTPAIAVLLWLGYINVALSAFNMIPAYPLDGGRVLRAVLWWISHSQEHATRWASQVGQGVAFLFILLGVYRFFAGFGFGGLWIAFIGWFLLDAARTTYMQLGIMAGLRGRTVADLMERNCPTVPGYLSLRDFVDECLLHSSSHCFFVVSDSHITGLVTPGEPLRVPRDDWAQTSVQSVMQRVDNLRKVPPQTRAVEALEMMARENIGHLAVISHGTLQGIFSQSQVLRFLDFYSGRPPDDRLKKAA